MHEDIPTPTEATAHVAHTGLDMDWVTKETEVYSVLQPQPTLMLARTTEKEARTSRDTLPLCNVMYYPVLW